MGDTDSQWAVKEALLLCADDSERWIPSACPDAGQCEVFTTMHTFNPLLGAVGPNNIPHTTKKSMEGSVARCTVTKVVTKMRCSLRAFTTFITKPQNIEYHEDEPIFCEIIRKEKKTVLVHTAYQRSQPFDLVTLHQSIMLRVPDADEKSILLKSFLSTISKQQKGKVRSNSTLSTDGGAKGDSEFIPSKVYVYTIRSVSLDSLPPSPEYIRGWVYFSAFVAYETPGPCVELVFLHAPDNVASAAIRWCDKKVLQIRRLSEMLHRMMLKGALTLRQQWKQECERMQMPYELKMDSSIPSAPKSPKLQDSVHTVKPKLFPPGYLTKDRRNILLPLMLLHTKAIWHFTLEREGCKVEECEARQYLHVPPFLKAYRISATFACSLETFFRLVGDPLQTHRYDAFLESSSVISTLNEGVGVYARYRSLFANTLKRDMCVILSTALLQPSEVEEDELLSSLGESKTMYLQNATDYTEYPQCDGYERQTVYVFGYVAIGSTNAATSTAAAADNACIKVYHIVCTDSTDASNQRLEMAMMQEHCTRMSWVRQVCNDFEENGPSILKTASVYPSQKDVKNGANMNGTAVFADTSSVDDNMSFDRSGNTSPCRNAECDSKLREIRFERNHSPLEAARVGRRATCSPFRPKSPHPRVFDSDFTSDDQTLYTNTNGESYPFVDDKTVAAPYDGCKALLPKRQPRSQKTICIDVLRWRNLDSRHTGNNELFITLQTSDLRVRTAPVAFSGTSDFCNEKFRFEVQDSNAMTVKAVVSTHSGEMKCFGKAIIPLKNFCSSVAYTRSVALVRRAGTNGAYVCGEVFLSLSGGRGRSGSRSNSRSNSRGRTQSVPQRAQEQEEEKKESLRRRINQLLMASDRRNLHRLEWIVGLCSDKTPEEVEAFLARYENTSGKSASVLITVIDVKDLISEKGLPLFNSSFCHVLMEINNMKHQTRVVPLQQQQATFNESFRLEIGADESIRIVVFVGGLKIGEVFIALSTQERVCSHNLVSAAGTEEAAPCGKVTVVLRSSFASKTRKGREGTNPSQSPRRSVSLYNRGGLSEPLMNLGLLLWKTSRNLLHKLDVIASSTRQMDHYMKILGPNPEWCQLRVSVKRWEPSPAAWDGHFSPVFEERKNNDIDSKIVPHHHGFLKRCSVYAVIHSGMHHYKSAVVRTSDSGVAYFNDPVTLCGVLPERDEVLVAIVSKSVTGVDDINMGVIALPLRTLVHQQPTMYTVPLVVYAGGGDAHFGGLLEVELLAVNFGNREVPIQGEATPHCRARVQQLLYLYIPQELHRVECFLANFAGREKELIADLLKHTGPEELPSPMQIRLIGIRSFMPACSCYVKVYLNGESVFRSPKQTGSTTITFSPGDARNAATVKLYDPQHSRLRFEVVHQRFLQSTSVSFTEISLRTMQAGVVNECWVPFFDGNNDKIGRLGVAVSSNGFIGREKKCMLREDVENDVSSLLRRYRPAVLPFLHPIMTEVSNLATAHAELRRMIATRPVAATVYIVVESICITDVCQSPSWTKQQQRQQQQPEWCETKYTVSATCDSDEGSTIWPGSRETLQEASIRLDIPEFDKQGRHNLAISIFPLRGERGLSQTKGSSRRRTDSVGSRTSSSRQNLQALQTVELGRVVVSLRALLTPSLYNPAERITLPLVSSQSHASRMPLQKKWIIEQQNTLKEGLKFKELVGSITFCVRLPENEVAPSWLQFNTAAMERCEPLDREYIRHKEGSIRDFMEQHNPQRLLDLHYELYEHDVASGKWSISLPKRVSLLQQRYRLRGKSVNGLDEKRRKTDATDDPIGGSRVKRRDGDASERSGTQRILFR